MHKAEVLIDRPIKRLDKAFSYLIPPSWGNLDLTGKRVLVEFNRTLSRGFVVGQSEIDYAGPLLEIVDVLDDTAVFNAELLFLAQWMSDFYVSPVTANLNLMIPALLKNRKNLKLKLINDQLPADAAPEVKHLFQRLRHEDLKRAEALTIVNAAQLQNLLDRKFIILTGNYVVKQVFARSNWVYTTSGANLSPAERERLLQGSPRQQEIVDRLQQEKQVGFLQLRRQFPLSSIKALEKKGLIQVIEKDLSQTEPAYQLTNQQKAIAAQIKQTITTDEEQRRILLWGVTGSGKTEVYIQAVTACLQAGKSAIVLLPEIALVHQMAAVFRQRFPDFAVMHSEMSAGGKYAEWVRVKQAHVSLVLGARSAVFAPVSNLGLIIIDEEQEPSYKQEQSPKYHALEIAQKRTAFNRAVLLMGSATPSCESFARALSGEYKLLKLEDRVVGRLPSVLVEDLKNYPLNKTPFTPPVAAMIQACLDRREQIIIFINRRGYAPRILCGQCGAFVTCPHCSVGMVAHRDKHACLCHYCNWQTDLSSGCPACGSHNLSIFGWGTQKIEAEAQKLFPQARIARLDIDSSQSKDYRQNLIRAMQAGHIDILIGTQMVAKGLDFPKVGLVLVAEADALLSLPDFRVGERAFQLFVQAIGRAGRGEREAKAVIQTFNPDHRVITKAVENDYFGFITEEIKIRKSLGYPPFTEILRWVVSGKEEQRAQEGSELLTEIIGSVLNERLEDWELLGPAPCPIRRLKNRYRYNILIKSSNRLFLQSLVAYVQAAWMPAADLRLEFELNPLLNM